MLVTPGSGFANKSNEGVQRAEQLITSARAVITANARLVIFHFIAVGEHIYTHTYACITQQGSYAHIRMTNMDAKAEATEEKTTRYGAKERGTAYRGSGYKKDVSGSN